MADLRRARERVGLTQTELAAQLNVSQSMVSRYETNVGQAPFDLVVRWLSACGTDLVTAIREFANTVDLGGGLDPGRPYELLDRDLILIERHIKTVLPESLTAMTPGAPNPKKLEELLRRWRKKPTVLLSGKIESGKFRLAKFLLGIDLVPSRNTKTTTLPMFIRHLDEQPQWQPERVWILDSTFDPRRWDDEDHCAGCKLISGGFQTLRDHGSRVRDNSIRLERAAGAALIYVDSRVLHACDLIVLPSTGETGPEDTCLNISFRLADIFIYASARLDHLEYRDFDAMLDIARWLPCVESEPSSLFPTLANLFVVATNANKGFSDKELGKIRKRAARRIFRYLKESPGSDTHQSFSEDLLESRIFTFWEKLLKRNTRLAAELLDVLSTHMPRRLMASVSSHLAQFEKDGMDLYARQGETYSRIRRGLNRLKRDADEVLAREETRNDNL